MPHVQWQLRLGRPCIEIALTLTAGGQSYPRILLADSGAGSLQAGIDLILEEDDCVLCGGFAAHPVVVGGAYVGSFPVYDLPVQVPALGFVQYVRAVGVPTVPAGFDGIACFSFLNRFHYGNFGDRGVFGLEI